VDQNIDNRHKEILWDLLASPAENGQLYKHNLERLVQDNPQSGLLQVMYARSLQTPDIRKAAAYFSPKALHKLMHDPDGLLPVSRDRVNKAYNGSQATEPENYFNIGEAAEVISEAPVAEGESLVPQDAAPPIDNFASTGEFAPEQDQQLPAVQEGENAATLPTEGFTAEPAYQTPAPEAQDEPTYDTPPPVPQAEQTHYQQVLQTEPVCHSPAPDDDDEDAFANPWDLSKLEDTEQITVSEPETEQAQEPVTETLPEPEKAPEPEAEKAPETQPEPAAAAPEEPQIDTYDHSLSAFEQHAVNEAEAPELTETAEVSSFESYYRPENVFHRQDDIEDEVYDEIVSIDDIGVESLGNKFAEDTDEAPTEATEPDEEANTAQQTYIDDETEKLIYGNIAATDYLSFDKKLDELRAGTAGTAIEPAAETAAPQVQPVTELPLALPEPQALPQIAEAAKEPDVISKYNDDTLPYSFMWWLDKTRKEHAGVNQPYAEPVRPELQQPAPSANDNKNNAPDELQQQYYTNIFNLTSVSGIGEIEPAQIEFDHTKKEDIIIERFIHTDPQIKPLAADKLDNENKAKKSSEDQDAMVTETLARIYGDQMLYHKAIATYKKLMLKIPEKKLYFAAQIEQLEKKIN
jgi:hypothetical protein